MITRTNAQIHPRTDERTRATTKRKTQLITRKASRLRREESSDNELIQPLMKSFHLSESPSQFGTKFFSVITAIAKRFRNHGDSKNMKRRSVRGNEHPSSSSSSWQWDTTSDWSNGKRADGDGHGGNAWDGNSDGKRWDDKEWSERKWSEGKWGTSGWNESKSGQDRSRGDSGWNESKSGQDRSRGDSSQSRDTQGSSWHSSDQTDWKKTINSLSLEPGSGSPVLPANRRQELFLWLKQDVIDEFVAAGLEWGESNLQCGPSLSLEHFEDVQMGEGYKYHNCALKHFRDQIRNRYGAQFEDAIEYGLEHNPQSRYMIPHVMHKEDGNYKSDFGTLRDWQWRQMIAQLHADSMEYVVHGGDRSRGIVRCSVVGYAKSDIKTDRKNRNNLKQEPENSEKTYDFAIWRSDGSCILLHPEFTRTKFYCTVGEPRPDNELPASGIGGTSGQKTFQRLMKKNRDRILRFDASKVGHHPQIHCVARVRVAQPPQRAFPPPPPPGGPPQSNVQPLVNAVPVDPDPAQAVQPVEPHPPQHPPGVFIYEDGSKTGMPPPPPPRPNAKASPPTLEIVETVADNTASAVAAHSGLNASKDAPPQSRHTDGTMAPSNVLKESENVDMDGFFEQCRENFSDNLSTYHGGESAATRMEQSMISVDAALVDASQPWPLPQPPVVEPTPLSETTPKAPPPVAPLAPPRQLKLGPPPLLTPQSREISESHPASSTEDYEHAPQTEDNVSTPAPAPSTEENASPPAPAPSTEENTSPPASVPSTEENTSTPASLPEMVPSTEDNEDPGDLGDSGCFEMVPEPARSGEAAAVLSIVYVKAADISDEP